MRRRPVEPTAVVDPELWEPEFRTYLHSPLTTIDSMLVAFEQRQYRATISDGRFSIKELVILRPDHLAALRRNIARRILEAGGEFRTRSVWVRSDDGVTFTTHLPGA